MRGNTIDCKCCSLREVSFWVVPSHQFSRLVRCSTPDLKSYGRIIEEQELEGEDLEDDIENMKIEAKVQIIEVL
jgi:hypothetical protein